MDHYGLRVAELARLPREMLTASWAIARKVEARWGIHLALHVYTIMLTNINVSHSMQ